jgi:predicted hydrolase (HD superfamily)
LDVGSLAMPAALLVVGPDPTIRSEETFMAITHKQAVEKLHEWTDSLALRNHARAVEAAMRRAAHRYGAGAADEPRWAIAGFLHDADYERWPDEHPRRIVAWLREQGEPEIAQAIVAHFNPSDVPELTALDKALLACDELTGFIMACCLVRPEGIRSLNPSSVKKKLKDKSFAAKVDRGDVYAGVERLGVSLEEHTQLVIDALIPHAEALGIAGSH